MKSVFSFVVGVMVLGFGFVSTGSENVGLFIEQLAAGPGAVTVSLSDLGPDELLELTEKAAPVLLIEGESGRVMAGILEALCASWETGAPAGAVSGLISNNGNGAMFRWALMECVGARSDLFSRSEVAGLIGDMTGILGDATDDGVVRRKAAITVSLLGRSDKDVHAALVAGLADADLRVVEGTACGLRNITDRKNGPALVIALGRLQLQSASMEKDFDDGFVDRQFANTLCQVALALGRQNGAGCADALGGLLGGVTDSGVKGPVLYSLSQMEDAGAVPYLLSNDFCRTRYLKKAAGLLVDALSADELPEGAGLVDVIEALGQIRCSDAVAGLQGFLNDADADVAKAAASALALIGE